VRALRRALLFVGLVGWGLIGAAEPLVLDIADFNQDITIFGANAKDFSHRLQFDRHRGRQRRRLR
jgi:hypothetical protein